MGLKIVAMPSGFVKGVRGSAVTFMRNNDKEFELSMLMFAVLGGEHPVMVDTGTPPVDYVREHHGYHSFERPDEHEPRRVLAEHGIDPADVRTVIFTHLHWDHCSNTDLFPNATFYVQAEELRFAIDPIPVFRKAYERLPTNEPSWLPVLRRFQTVDGEREIVPGISVVPLPGHTPGSQGVLVETDEGRFLLAGDCIDRYENWEGDATLDHIPVGSFTNLHAYMDSIALIEKLNCEVIPSHDPRVLARKVFG